MWSERRSFQDATRNKAPFDSFWCCHLWKRRACTVISLSLLPWPETETEMETERSVRGKGEIGQTWGGVKGAAGSRGGRAFSYGTRDWFCQGESSGHASLPCNGLTIQSITCAEGNARAHTHTHTLIRRKGIEFACDTSGFLSLSDSMSPKKLVFQQSLYQEITKNKSQIVSPLAP